MMQRNWVEVWLVVHNSTELVDEAALRTVANFFLRRILATSPGVNANVLSSSRNIPHVLSTSSIRNRNLTSTNNCIEDLSHLNPQHHFATHTTAWQQEQHDHKSLQTSVLSFVCIELLFFNSLWILWDFMKFLTDLRLTKQTRLWSLHMWQPRKSPVFLIKTD